MPEEARKALLLEGSQDQTQTTPAGAAGSTTGGDPRRPSTTSVPFLNSAWLQPAVPTWLVQPSSASANAFSCLPPHTPLFQGTPGRDGRPPDPHSVAPLPSIHSRGMTGNLPGMFVGPVSCQFGPTKQWYSHLQPVTSLQIVPMQPQGQGQKTPAQDGRGLFLQSHTTFGPLLQGERPTVHPGGRQVCMPPLPRQDMVLVLKQVEPKTLEKAPPAPGFYPVPSALRKRQITTTATKVMNAAPSASQQSHQPSSVQPDDGGSGKVNNSLFADLDEVQLPDHLLSQKYPEIEKLIASFEPLLESIETEHKTEASFFKETRVLRAKESVGIPQGQIVRGQAQDNNKPTPETPKWRQTGVCPLPTSATLLTTQENHVSELAERATENNTKTHENLFISETICISNEQAQLAKMNITGPKNAPKLRDGSQTKRPASEKNSTNSQAWGIPAKRKCPDKGPKSSRILPTLTAKLGSDVPPSVASHQCPEATATKAEATGKRKSVLLDVEFFHIPSPAGTGCKASKPKAFQAGASKGPKKEQRSHQWGKEKTPGNGTAELPRQQALPYQRDKPFKGPPAVIQHPSMHLQRDPQTASPSAKRPCAKRKRAEQEPPTGGQFILPLEEETSHEKNPEKKARGSRLPVLQTDKKNSQPKQASTTKGTQRSTKMVAKPCTEACQPVPKSKLALQLMESVQVFYPLGKSNLSTMPAKKATTSSSSIPGKSVSIAARPLPNPQPNPLLKPLPKPLPKPLTKTSASSLTKPVPPASQPRPPPPPLARPSQKPAQLQQPLPRPKPQPTVLKKPLPQAGPKPSVPSCQEAKPSDQQHSQTTVSKAQPSVVGRTSHLPPRDGLAKQASQKPSSSQSQRPVSTAINFRPRTLPRDHHLVFRYSPPPPVLPFEVAFSHWKPPRDDLEESTPITPEQRPVREMMKRQAQREREEAAQWTSVGRVQFFVERKKEKDLSVMYGYP